MCTVSAIVAAPITGTSSSSVTALPLCRARRVTLRRLTHSWASSRVIADICQPAHWGSHALPTDRRLGLGLRVDRAGGRHPGLPLANPDVPGPGVAESPLASAHSWSVAHCLTTLLSRSVFVCRFSSGPRTVACQSPDGNLRMYTATALLLLLVMVQPPEDLCVQRAAITLGRPLQALVQFIRSRSVICWVMASNTITVMAPLPAGHDVRRPFALRVHASM